MPLVVLVGGIAVLLYHPNTPLDPAWNPVQPLNPKAQITPVTQWKLQRTVADPVLCAAALKRSGARFSTLSDRNDSDVCHIRSRTKLQGLNQANIGSVETRCELALRLSLWEIHGLQPLAEEIFGKNIKIIHHFGSYSCRKIRGSSNRMSQHATANALDISGFDLTDGTRIRLRDHWLNQSAKSEFLHRARKNACDWFHLVLSPEYNAAHHDHFHLDQGFWGGCK